MLISRTAKDWLNDAMTIDEIRLVNLLLLVKECGGNQAELSRRVDTPATYINQIVKGTLTRSGSRRGVGDELARKLETGMKKPVGWMDKSHDEPGNRQMSEPTAGYMELGELTQRERELVLMAREFGWTDVFLQIAKKHIIDQDKK